MTSQVDGITERASALHALVSASPDHFYLYDRAGRHIYVSPAVAQALGIEQAAFVGKTWQEMGFLPEVTRRFDIEREKVFESGGIWRGEINLPTDLGVPNSWHEYILSPVRASDGAVEAVLVTARDVTERKQTESEIRYQALHDVLTGLANRTLLDDRIAQSLLTSKRTNSPLALLFLDLDHFKDVNDAFGHHTGDLLLQQVSNRWSRVLRASDTLSRLGGDEFIVLLPASNTEGATEIMSRLQAELEEAFDIEGEQLRMSVSVGMAVHEGGHEEANDLLRRADISMYRAKRARIHGHNL